MGLGPENGWDWVIVQVPAVSSKACGANDAAADWLRRWLLSKGRAYHLASVTKGSSKRRAAAWLTNPPCKGGESALGKTSGVGMHVLFPPSPRRQTAHTLGSWRAASQETEERIARVIAEDIDAARARLGCGMLAARSKAPHLLG